jgi:hypothetical protein
MLQVYYVSILSSSKNSVVIKITIGHDECQILHI